MLNAIVKAAARLRTQKTQKTDASLIVPTRDAQVLAPGKGNDDFSLGEHGDFFALLRR
jgi:hypothetical protein